jgi:hypothetical protein
MMNKRKWIQPILFTLVVAAAFLVGGAQATSNGRDPVLKTAKVRGKWRIAWDVRLGTVRGILDLKQNAAQVTGTFFEEINGKSFPLSGIVQGSDFTFDVSFTGPPPFTIEFKGTVDGEKITGTSAMKGSGQVFLGHAGEVDEPQHPWTATRGLKHQNEGPPRKPPKEDDDDDHPH